MDATKLYLHFGRFAGDVILCYNSFVEYCFKVYGIFHKIRIFTISDLNYISNCAFLFVFFKSTEN